VRTSRTWRRRGLQRGRRERVERTSTWTPRRLRRGVVRAALPGRLVSHVATTAASRESRGLHQGQEKPAHLGQRRGHRPGNEEDTALGVERTSTWTPRSLLSLGVARGSRGLHQGVVRGLPAWTPREAFPPAVYGCPMMPYTQTWTRAYPHTLRLCAALFDCRRVAQPLKRET